jgi:hypothetical protein
MIRVDVKIKDDKYLGIERILSKKITIHFSKAKPK